MDKTTAAQNARGFRGQIRRVSSPIKKGAITMRGNIASTKTTAERRGGQGCVSNLLMTSRESTGIHVPYRHHDKTRGRCAGDERQDAGPRLRNSPAEYDE